MQEVFPNNIVDLSLRVRQTPVGVGAAAEGDHHRVDEFCMEYESRYGRWAASALLGGIGPDGAHRLQRPRLQLLFPVTRLTGTNYETQAAAATDLGGIEISRSAGDHHRPRDHHLQPTATAIIVAAGDGRPPCHDGCAGGERTPVPRPRCCRTCRTPAFYLTKGRRAGWWSADRGLSVNAPRSPTDDRRPPSSGFSLRRAKN